MSQNTSLNVSPYFDDFDPLKNYYRVLFKPGYPVQARELNTLQSALQNQIEKFGSHFFKEGQRIVPGNINYFKDFDCVQINASYIGVSIGEYLNKLENLIIIGGTSGVTAKVVKAISNTQSERGNYTLYVSYINSNIDNKSSKTFIDDENLITTTPFTYRNVTIGANTPFARTIASSSTDTGSAFSVNKGIYFIRGNFVDVSDQLIILDQYSNTPNYRVGFYVNEELISSSDDSSLNDNARGFTNYAAAGADRLKVTVELNKKELNDYNDDNFIELISIKNGVLQTSRNSLSVKTGEENSSITQFDISVNETLNDEISSNGLFKPGRLTYNGNVPSDELITYKISPGKVIIDGEIVEILETSFLDAPKPRQIKRLSNQQINYYTGPTLSVNRFSGTPIVGLTTDYVLSLRSQRVGFATFFAPGTEIGVSRIYDYKLKNVGYSTISSEANIFDLSLFDIQLYTNLSLNSNVTLTVPTYVRGKNSGATGYLKFASTNTSTITLYQTNGDFKVGEELVFNESDSVVVRTISSIRKFEIDSVKSVFGNAGGGNIFVADVMQSERRSSGPIGLSTEAPVTTPASFSTGILTATSATIGAALTAPLSMVGVVTAVDGVHTQIGVPTSSNVTFGVLSPTIGIGTTVPISMVGIVTGPPILGFATYLGALNRNPEVTWTFPTLPTGVSTGTHEVKLQDLATGDIHWRVTGIPTATNSIGFGTTSIPGATIMRNYIMSGDGSIGVGSINPSGLAIGPEYVSGLTTVGYAGPQAPIGEIHNYRLSVTTNLIGGTTASITTSITVGLGTSGTIIPNAGAPSPADNVSVGIISYFPLYGGALNQSPGLTINIGALPVGVSLSSYTIHFQDLSSGRVQWHVTDIPPIGILAPNPLTIPGATIQRNYLMSAPGAVGVGSVNPSLVAIGASYISGISTVGYSGPQPPAGSYHTYRLSVSGILSGSPSTLTTSITVGFGSTGSTPVGALFPPVFPDNNEIVISEVRGISTVTSASIDFISSLRVDDLVTFIKPGSVLPTFGRVVGVGSTTFQLEATPAVPGVSEVGVTTSSINVSEAQLVSSKYSSTSDNTYYTPLLKKNIESIDLSTSSVIVKRQYNVTAIGGTSNTLTCPIDEEFIDFNENRYALTLNRSIQRLTSTNIVIGGLRKSLTLVGLSTNGTGTLTVSVRKLNATSKVKQKNAVKTLIVDKTKHRGSSLGLTFGNYPYGTRIEDREISLNTPDVIKVYGIFESTSSSNPSAPRVTLNDLDGPNNDTRDLIVGEVITGSSSRAKAIVAEIINTTSVTFIYLNNNRFKVSEQVSFDTSNINGTISALVNGDKDVTSQYRFNDGQNQNYYNYSSIIRTSSYGEPKGKLKIYFMSASYLTSDTGDITSANSYTNFNYLDEIRSINGVRNTDLIDIRPRVSDYIVAENARSPFEFDARSFNRTNSSSFNILSADESITLSYGYYIPRIDKIYVTKNGLIEVKYGNDSESAENPEISSNSIEIASITLPPYLYNVNQSHINYSKNKRFTLSDIRSLEERLKQLENTTSLSLLEIETNSLFIRDSQGLNRFKSGFYVDDFTSLHNQELSIGIRNSIDINSEELRPSHKTEEIDLIVGSELISGVTGISSLNGDSRFISSIQGNSIKKTGDLITLNYTEEEWLNNPFASKKEKINPVAGKIWQGSIELNPSSDVWLDNTKVSSKNIEVNASYLGLSEWLIGSEDIDFNSGFIPVQWDCWSILWTGKLDNSDSLQNSTNYDSQNQLNSLFGDGSIAQRLNETNRAQDQFLNGTTPSSIRIQRGFSSNVSDNENNLSTLSPLNGRNNRRRSIQSKLNVYTKDNKFLTKDITTYLRTRNVEFIGRRLKPFTKLYAYFDGVNLTQYTTPKLIPIQMIINSFVVGETVIGYSSSTNEPIFKFRVSVPNHKEGPYNNPTKIYEENPYDRTQILTSTYSATSEFLNIDTYSLSEKNNFDFYGYVESGMTLFGQTSQAKATVGNVELITDKSGYVCGSIYIPNPNNNNQPSFETGFKTITLTSNPTNSKAITAVTTIAEETFAAQGLLSAEDDALLSTRVLKIERETIRDNDSLERLSVSSRTSRSLKTSSSVSNYQENNGIYSDPLAQTFFVDDSTGIFVTKLDVYFSEKDTVIPVTCQLRTVENGIPTNKVLPFSEITLDPSQVNISSDASSATTFTFNSPVYLKGKTEYAIVLISNSSNYSAWISKNGDVNVGMASTIQASKVLISKPSLINSLFKPQNVFEWDSTSYESLKFKLTKTIFESQGSVNFYNPNLTVSNNQITNLGNNPLFVNSRKVLIGIGTTVNDAGLQIGNTISQIGSNVFGTLVGFGTTTPVIIGVATASITSATVGFGSTAPLSMVGIATTGTLPGITTYVGAGNTSPQLSWSFGSLPIGVSITSYNLLFEDLSAANTIHWNVVGIATSITTLPLNVGSTGFGTQAVIRPTFVGSFPTIGVSSGGYSGPQPPDGEYHTYRLTVSALLSGASSSTLTTSYTIGFGTTGSTIIPAGAPSIPDNLNILSSSATPSGIIVDNVQGQFLTGPANFIQYTNNSGVTTTLNSASGNVTPLAPVIVLNDGLHMKVNHKNHGMYSKNNLVNISNIESDISPSTLTSNFVIGNTTLTIESTNNFTLFENVGVSSLNPGYLKINDEIIGYDSVVVTPTTTTIGISSRGVDGTKSYDYTTGTLVYKYELSGVSLRRINKNHDLNNVTISDPIGLDYYHIKVGMSSDGINRSSNPSQQDLFFNNSRVVGGKNVYATKNIQFESVTPIIQRLVPSGTNIVSSIRTVSGTSIGGTETSYRDNGYQNISLDGLTYFDSPRIIASKVNENVNLTSLPGNKSLNLRMNLSTTDNRVSPAIDLDRIALLLTENRVNNPISDYANDPRVNTLYDDPNAFQYVSKQINLATPGSGIKILLSAHINSFCDIRAFYSINNRDGDRPIFTPFPGFNNIDSNGRIINSNNNDGRSDVKMQPASNISYSSESASFTQYEFTINELPSFTDFRIKLVLTSTNQAFVPRVKDLKVIALA